jgi:hypothetical protein
MIVPGFTWEDFPVPKLQGYNNPQSITLFDETKGKLLFWEAPLDGKVKLV